jgi:hypothetical protein
MSKIIKIEDKCPAWCPFVFNPENRIQKPVLEDPQNFSVAKCCRVLWWLHDDYWKKETFKKCHLKIFRN